MRIAASARETVVWTIPVTGKTRFSWWREHGQHFAHIDPSGDRKWRISLWYGSTCVFEGSRCHYRLTAAKAAADNMLRRTFGHKCHRHICSRWVEVAR
jgi:hypothetical protein